MPFSSWKKKAKKNNNISHFFRDHIQSHRRRAGGSLVVETGFPTSLVDLIVKNRQILKRSSEIEVPRDSSFILESSPPPPSPLPLPLPPPSPPTLLNHRVEERDDTVAEEVKDGENCKGVLMAVLRAFFVVVLALGTKKFAVGLTMSAFLLILVEYLGKRFFGLLIPCCDAKKEMRLMIVKILRFMGITGGKLEGKKAGFKEEMKSVCSDLKNDSTSNEDSVGEIQILQAKSSFASSIEDVQRIEKRIDKSGCDGNLKLRKPDSLAAFLEEEDEYTCEVLEIKKKKSRRAKIKSKLKHIFARKSRREKKEGILESNLCVIEENNAAKEVEGQRNERKLECDSNLSSISSGSYEGKEAITLICGSDKALMDGVVTSEVEGSQEKGNSGYLFLCIIVLIGLSGGRMSALLLILSCCLVKKSGGKLRRCWIPPVIRHFRPDI